MKMFSCLFRRVEAEDPSEECCWSSLLVSYVRAIFSNRDVLCDLVEDKTGCSFSGEWQAMTKAMTSFFFHAQKVLGILFS